MFDPNPQRVLGTTFDSSTQLYSRVRRPISQGRTPLWRIATGYDLRFANDPVIRQAERLQALHAINRGILAAESVQDIAGEALSRIRALLPCDRAAIGVFDWTTREAIVFAVDVDGTEADTTGVRYPMDDMAEMLEALSQDEPFLIEDMSAIDLLPPVLERYRAVGMRSNMQIALSSVERPVGLLSVMSAQPRAFSPEDVEVAGEVASLLAIAIQQSDARRAAIGHERMKTDLLNILAHELFTPIATIGSAPIPVDSLAGKISSGMSDLEDGLELDRCELAEAALTTPTVIRGFDPVHDRQA